MGNRFELKKIEGKGQGVFATQTFEPGETVMVGRIEKILDQNNSHASQINENTFVLHAGLISKVNHSCSPNCGIKLNETGGHNFVAIKKIGKHEEITFDYAMRNYSIDHFPHECMCSSSACRRKITGWKDLSEAKKNEYKDFVAPYLFELDKKSVRNELCK